MRPKLFLSDLHLHDSRPQIAELFFSFLKSETATSASGIYILGDLFEFWAGDDANTYPEVINALRSTVDNGIPTYFMRGNRDFLVGDKFQHDTGCVLLDDPTIINIDDQPVLLMHGDTLCTDDHEYQAFRTEVRSSEWQSRAMSMPLPERMEYFQYIRAASKKSIQEKPSDIMDVNQHTVERKMSEANTHFLIHGHTHRQDIHQFNINAEPACRVVLGDWYNNGNVLIVNSTSDYRFMTLNTG